MTDIVITCPYCKNNLEKMPERRKKCNFCGNFMYVRTLPSNRKRVLVTEDEAKKIDEKWKEYHSLSRWKEYLKGYGVTEGEFENHKKRLSLKFGCEANEADVIWSIYNELILAKRDFQTLKLIYYQMAMLLNAEGKDCFSTLQESRKMQLHLYKQIYREAGIKEIQIVTCGIDACEECRKLDERIFTIEKALDEMPIPNRNCTHILFNENQGFCRCGYKPLI